MKRLHRPDLLTWSAYDPALMIDFNSLVWTRPDGNVLIDPLSLTADDEKHLRSMGGAAWILMTNSDHVRGAREIAAGMGARAIGPIAERDAFPVPCDRWVGDGDQPFPGLVVHEIRGSKTPGELALVLEETTVIFGDAVRAHRADTLMLLPEAKLRVRNDVLQSIRRIRTLHPRIEHVLVGDGWCSFRHGGTLLDELAGSA